MNVSPIAAKERGILILEGLTNAPKNSGRPRMVKITDTPKKLGRPPKKIDKFFTQEASVEDIKALSASISGELGVPDGDLTISLAVAAVSYSVMEKVRHQAPLKRKKKGNRSNIHSSMLLADCAEIHENLTGENARSALAKIGGWGEADGAPQSQVLVYANAVLSALGIRHAQSLRHQARRALELI